MPNKQFLEEYPLYRKFAIELPQCVVHVENPEISRYCDKCGMLQLFRMSHPWAADSTYTAGVVKTAEYCCVACKTIGVTFMVYFDPGGKWVMKVGQHPAWSIAIDDQMKTMLAEHAPLYKCGLICESQSYGIAAFAYYRRIVEATVDQLLDAIGNSLKGEEAARYATALAKAKAATVASDKIAIVKDTLPPVLRPNNANPLDLLHDALSVGLHKLSDEECLQQADAIRKTLVFLVHQINKKDDVARDYTEAIKKLQDQRAAKGVIGRKDQPPQ